MKTTHSVVYIDRRTGERREEPIYKRGLLDWLHNSATGWFLTRFILSRRVVSQAYAWPNKRRWSARKIPGFVKSMGVTMEESLRRAEDFSSFNDFMTREIDLSRRPIASDPRDCAASADGRIRAYPVVTAETCFTLKRSAFDLSRFLRDDELAKTYANGALVISRLYLADYHHFHFPDDGVARVPISIPGRLYATTPYSRRRIVPYFAENHRMLTLFDSEHFGRIALVEVGAFTMGSIQQRFQPGGRVRKGDHKGFFGLGGSVVAMLFEPGAIQLDADLCGNTHAGLETYVHLGESIGRTPV